MTYPIRFSVDGGQPSVAFAMQVFEDLTMTVDVLTVASLPQEPPLRFGTFTGRLDQQTAQALAEWTQNAPTLDEGTAVPPGTTFRQLSVGGGTPRIVHPDALDPQLEERLAASAGAALAHPEAAAEFAAVDAELQIRGLGEQPFRLLLVDPDVAGYWAKIWRDDPADPNGRRYLEREQLAAVRQGVVELAPGEVLAVPLPPGPAETGGFVCWRAGAGPQRSILAGTWSHTRG